MIDTIKDTLNNKIDTLNLLIKNLNEVTYKKTKITSNDLVKEHTYNLRKETECVKTFICYLEETSEFIYALKKDDILNFYEELKQVKDTKNKIKVNKELNISNYISLTSLSNNKKLNAKIDSFYLEISNIIDDIDCFYVNENKINDKITKISAQKQEITQNIIDEKQNIKKQIEKFQEELSKISKLNIFKRDKIKSDIDLLNQELILYEEKEIQINKEYNEKIIKENSKIFKLKESLK